MATLAQQVAVGLQTYTSTRFYNRWYTLVFDSSIFAPPKKLVYCGRPCRHTPTYTYVLS
jgi:hypothetical protein